MLPEVEHEERPGSAQPPVTGDLRLRVTRVPPKIDDGRDWLLLRGYVVDADGVEAVRESWHYVRPQA
ncbi:hypothetical protein ABNF97_19530 [Plantactinospora sp. B6F1]|uniref:hypothetical protein n=1 Tax=Plantactinospora sp. B6F1 TaxID=3158971 RepID=UPI0032D926F8